MPIYVEARNVSVGLGALGGHMYLVFVPDGEENNYSEWKTIGAFPETDSSLGPWGNLNGQFLGSILNGSGSRDEYPEGVEDPTAYANVNRGRQDIYSGADEGTVWANLVNAASQLDDTFTYKAFTLTNNINNYNTVFGPATNSNSFIASVLNNALGLDVANYLPDPTPNTGITNDYYPGAPRPYLGQTVSIIWRRVQT